MIVIVIEVVSEERNLVDNGYRYPSPFILAATNSEKCPDVDFDLD